MRTILIATCAAAIVGATILVAGAYSGDTTTTSAPKAATPASAAKGKDKQDRIICKELEEEATGSHLGGRKICHTKREWDAIHAGETARPAGQSSD